MSAQRAPFKKSPSLQQMDDFSAIPKIKSNIGFKRQMTGNLDDMKLVTPNKSKKQPNLSSSVSVNLNKNKLQSSSASVFSPSSPSSSMLLFKDKLRSKIKKNEEGFEGLPDDCETVDEKNFENEDQCYLCLKALAKKFGGLRKKGRHHCRKCGRTVCDRCRQNRKRISKNDKNEYLVCDQCDFQIANYHIHGIQEEMKLQQQSTMNSLQQKNQQVEQEIRFYKESKKGLQNDVSDKRDEFEQLQAREKNVLQKLHLEHERLNHTITLLGENQKMEQEKRQQLQSERTKLTVQSDELKFKIQQNELDMKQMKTQQQNSFNLICSRFSKEVQEIIRAKFDKIRYMSDSEMLENSEILQFQESTGDRFTES